MKISPKNHGLVSLISSSFVSNTFDGVRIASYSIMAWELTHSAFLVALMSVGATIALLIFMPFAGVIADRLNRLHLMFIGDLARVAIYGVITIIIFNGWLNYWILFGSVFVIHVFEAITDTGLGAFIPQLIEDQSQFDRVNSLRITVIELSNGMIGPALGGIIVSLNQGISLLSVTLGYGVAAVLVMDVIWVVRKHKLQVEQNKLGFRDIAQIKDFPFFRELKEAADMVFKTYELRTILFAAILFNFGAWWGWNVFVVYVSEILHQPNYIYGILWGVTSVAAVIGGVLFSIIGNKIPTFFVFIYAFLSSAVCNLILGFTTNLPIVVIFLFVIGIPNVVLSARIWTVIQGKLSHTVLGRITAIFWFLEILAYGLAQLLSGIVAELMNAQITFLFSGVIMAIGTAFFWRPFKKANLEITDSASPPRDIPEV